MTTTTDVMNRPRSSGPDPSSTPENSSEPQWENKALGRGARTKVKAALEDGIGSDVLEPDSNDGTITHQREEEASLTTRRMRG